jgi:hypothetical protein
MRRARRVDPRAFDLNTTPCLMCGYRIPPSEIVLKSCEPAGL